MKIDQFKKGEIIFYVTLIGILFKRNLYTLLLITKLIERNDDPMIEINISQEHENLNENSSKSRI